MKRSEVDALIQGLCPPIKAFIVAEIGKRDERITALEKRLALLDGGVVETEAEDIDVDQLFATFNMSVAAPGEG